MEPKPAWLMLAWNIFLGVLAAIMFAERLYKSHIKKQVTDGITNEMLQKQLADVRAEVASLRGAVNNANELLSPAISGINAKIIDIQLSLATIRGAQQERDKQDLRRRS